MLGRIEGGRRSRRRRLRRSDAISGRELEQTLGDGEGQGSPERLSPRGLTDGEGQGGPERLSPRGLTDGEGQGGPERLSPRGRTELTRRGDGTTSAQMQSI